MNNLLFEYFYFFCALKNFFLKILESNSGFKYYLCERKINFGFKRVKKALLLSFIFAQTLFNLV